MKTKSISGPGGAHIQNMFSRGPLLGPQDGAGGSGGAAGAAGLPAGGNQQGSQGDGSQPALNDEMKKEVAEMINGHINASLTNHLGRFKKQFSEEITGMLGSQLSPIAEQMKAFAEMQKAPAQPQQGQPAQNPALQEMQNALRKSEERIRELEGVAKAEREAREQEKATRLRDEERSVLASALRAQGFADPAIKAAVAMLHTEDKRIGRTEDGKIVFRIPKGTGAASYVDELDVDKGVMEWMKSDEGKSFVPPRPAQGAGGQAARPGQRPNSPGEARAQAAAELAKQLLNG